MEHVEQYAAVSSPLVFRLKSVTPMFMAGAHNVLKRDIRDSAGNIVRTIPEDYHPELRTPSIRGVLRYWFRACQGSFLFNDISELQKREHIIFGSTTAGSPFNLSVEILAQPKERLPMLIHGERDKIRVEALRQVEFNMKVAPRLGQAFERDLLKIAVTLLAEFGGMGKRSRRGFGSLQLIDGHPMPDSGEKLRQRLHKLCKELFSGLAQTPFANYPSHPVMHPDHCKIMVGVQPFKSYREAMQVFWDQIRAHRRFQNVLIQDNPVLGTSDPRFAAPIQLHISRTEDGYHPVVIAFRTDHQPNGSPLNWSLAANVIDQIAGNCQGKYVLGGGTQW